MNERIYLSPPHMGEREQQYVTSAFDSNWIAPLGPNVDAFEAETCAYSGAGHALALSSGTAAIHLALIALGIGAGDEVLVSDLTFSASVNPIIYVGGRPTLLDSERTSWNLDPNILEEVLCQRAQTNQLPKAVIVVHLYGQAADLDAIMALCEQYDVPLIEDSAESVGATYKGKHTGTFGKMGIYSYNGNKIITTSGGGMLVSDDEALIAHARKLSTQARDAAPHYQHSEIGYNYRLSNILAGVGRGQLELIEDRVAARRRNFDFYLETIGRLPGITPMPDAGWGRHNRWLSVIQIDPAQFGATCEEVRLALGAENIEARPVWKPMHLQPVFEQYEYVGGKVGESLFENGLCLPSGSALTTAQLERITNIIINCHHA